MPSTASDPLSQDGVKSISALLAGVGVPSILWGEYLLTVYGVPTIVGGIDFVVPDDKMLLAVATLKRSHLRPCPDLDACIVSGDRSPFPSPAFHMHIPGSEIDVSLRLHSETLWFIPPPDKPPSSKREIGAASSPYYLEASSPELPPWRPGRGQGAFSSHGSPVLVPRAHVLLEAFIRLASAFREGHCNYFLQMVTYMAEYPFDDGLVNIDLLSKPCRTFWDKLEEAKLPVRQLVGELQRDLGDA
ncbi:hypothetical protein F5B22DRAFT_602856 [Xylaria bambusicola]|uniref:uncharacterized protein n=1 Tax=Xylaria bambusicola TaxID=326684 RepID=UPI002007A40C|nr:uncharacterized protein F5B22DRAFT_602856 [Xylaria bambusicola]KAI0517887.1 hypothetical protein F5B22DRAFT_602856 [Xylaria bambusicola]